MSEVKVIKLVTGEEIVAEVLGDGIEIRNWVKITNPLMFRLVQVKSQIAGGAPQIGLDPRPWLAYTPNDVCPVISRTHIICMVDADEQVVKSYLSILEKEESDDKRTSIQHG